MSKKCTLLWCEARLQVDSLKNCDGRTTFGSRDVEKMHAVLARSTFASQHVEIATRSGFFWKLRCRKSARRCCAKHFGSEHVKNTACSDNFWTIRLPFDVVKVHAVVVRSTCASQKCKKKLVGFEPFLMCQMPCCRHIDAYRNRELDRWIDVKFLQLGKLVQ